MARAVHRGEERVITAHVPLALAERMDRAVEKLERSRAWVVKRALTDWLDTEDDKDRMTLEGLADVDAGRVIDDATVRAWAESLNTDNPLPLPLPNDAD